MSIEKEKKQAFIAEAISITGYLIYLSTISLPFEKHSTGNHSTPLIREHHDYYLYYSQYGTCEANFAEVPFNVKFNPANNINTGSFSQTIKA